MAQRGDYDVRTADWGRATSVVDVLSLSFSVDPFVRWLFPDQSAFIRWFPEFVWRYSGAAFEHGTADCTAEGEAAALWLEPGIRPDLTSISDFIDATISESKRAELWRVAEALMEATPVEPYWHLTLIGVDPIHQGRGAADSLLEHGLARCDADGRVAYLETSSPQTLSLFTRHGFELVDIIRMDTGPSIYALGREPPRGLR